MDPKQLSINDFTYSLPIHQIAYYPLAERDHSRLLFYNDSIITERYYHQLPDLIPAESFLVFNNTRVIEARLFFQKKTGAYIEIFCLEPHHKYGDITTAMQIQGSVVWMCLIGGASKWKPGQVLEKEVIYQDSALFLQAKFIEKINDRFAVELSWSPGHLPFSEVLRVSGLIPLPPYIKRKATAADAVRYQTIYAETSGSVAAPTAGLHFTPTLLAALDERRIRKDFVTLHVGAGTFKPVNSASMEFHHMHEEHFEVSIDTIENILFNIPGNITAVGTTSLRTIESLYWLGVKILLQPDKYIKSLSVGQWDPYELPADEISASLALNALITWLRENKKDHLVTTTQILIAPGYPFKIVKALITNFHQPQSTLLLLVAAFIGEDWKKVYDYALKNEFRFLSYGDGCLLQRH